MYADGVGKLLINANRINAREKAGQAQTFALRFSLWKRPA